MAKFARSGDVHRTVSLPPTPDLGLRTSEINPNPLPSSLPPLLWKPILAACAETSLESSELRAGAPLLNCCQYSGQVGLALWWRRWWLTCIAASLQPGHVECNFFHFLSVNIMNLMPWTASAIGIAACPISTALEETGESAYGS